MASERERVIAGLTSSSAICSEGKLAEKAYDAGYKAGVEAAAERLKKAAEAWATRQIDSEHEIAAVDFGPAQMLDDVLLPAPPACGS